MPVTYMTDLEDCLQIAKDGEIRSLLEREAYMIEAERKQAPEIYVMKHGSKAPVLLAEERLRAREYITNAHFNLHIKNVHLLNDPHLAASFSIARSIENDRGASAVLVFSDNGFEDSGPSIFVRDRLLLDGLEFILLSPKAEHRIAEVRQAYGNYPGLEIAGISGWGSIPPSAKLQKNYRH